MDRLDKSLDELAKESRKKQQEERKKNVKKDAPKKKAVKASGNEKKGAKMPADKPIKLAQPTAQAFARNVKVQRGVNDMASRLGPKVPSGVAVIFSNLNFNISQSDIRELCATIGPIGPKIFMKSNSGTADVMFDLKYDAIQAVKRFNNLTLDGRPMKVFLKDSNTSGAIPAVSQGRAAGPFGGRDLFGTRNTRQVNTSFQVNLGGVPAPKAKKQVAGKEKKVKVVKEKKEKPKKEKAAPATGEQLDADMDSYFANRAKKEE